MNVAELFARNAERNGDRVTLVYEGVGFSASQLRETADRLAGGLLGLGVGVDDRVAVMMPNSPDVPLAYDAVARIGAVSVPILFLLAPGEIRLICTDATPKVFMTSPEFAANVQQAIAGLDRPPHVLVVGTPEYEAFLSAAHPHTGILDRAAEDLAVVSFTGGTTGRSKGVMLTHGNLLAEIAMVRQILEYTPDAMSLGVLPWPTSSVWRRSCRPRSTASGRCSCGGSPPRGSWARSRSTASPPPRWSRRCSRSCSTIPTSRAAICPPSRRSSSVPPRSR